MYQFVYLMSGPGHLHNLVPSLYTLRQQHPSHYCEVYAYPESYDVVKRIADDTQLNITPRLWDPVRFHKNCQFINKIRLLQTLRCDGAVYLDADTTIHGDLTGLFRMLTDTEFVATQFCQWESNGRVVRARLERLRNYPSAIPQDAVDKVISAPYPSVNGGVLACEPTARILSIWELWSTTSQDIFISDEACLHLFQVLYPTQVFSIATGGMWNASHRYYRSSVKPRIWHYHGDSNFRPTKSPNAFAQWWPIYQTCLERNVGFIKEWHDQVEYKWLTELKKQLPV